MILQPRDVLADLVAIPSVNPMGRPVTGTPFYEDRLTDFLEQTFTGLGMLVHRQPVAPKRDNLVARLDGPPPPHGNGRILLLDAHQDTVPVEGMSIEPFSPCVRDGRLYGRGACDTKGPMAAMIAAVSRLAEFRPQGMPTIIVSCTVNEECGFTGARALTRLWSPTPGGMIPRRPDAAVVAEPTSLDVVIAHKGVVRWRCHARGRAAHSARPEAGENAIYRMGRALRDIEHYAQQIAHGAASHRLCGPPTLSVGTIQGGISVNTVPDRCTIEIDRRLPPGESPAMARQEFIDYLDAASEADSPLEHDLPDMEAPALSDQHNGDLACSLAKVVDEVVGGCRQMGVPYATNAAFYAAAGVPAVVWGPGSIEQAHTVDEWIALDQLDRAMEVCCRFCGLKA